MYPNIDVNKIMNGKTISTEESLKDITPVRWSEETLNQNYKNMPIIKTSEENRIQHVKKLIK